MKLSHADYIDDQEWGGLQKEQVVSMKSLRDLSSTIIMRRGISLTGTVTGPNGRPVADAIVVWGDDPYFDTGSQEVRTNEKGNYRFPPLPPGPIDVTVIAEGWAPTLKKTDISPANKPVDFKLKRGETVRIRFVESSGDRVPGVCVQIGGWCGGQSLYNHKHPNVLDTKIPRKAGAKGVYEWTWAPHDVVTYTFHKEGYRTSPGRSFSAGVLSFGALILLGAANTSMRLFVSFTHTYCESPQASSAVMPLVSMQVVFGLGSVGRRPQCQLDLLARYDKIRA